MTGHELQAARRTLGERWKGRPLHLEEMARVLRLSGKDPGGTLREYESRDQVSGPISPVVDMLLAGAEPPDGRP